VAPCTICAENNPKAIMPVIAAPTTAKVAATCPFEEPAAQGPVLSLAQARHEDAHWERAHLQERYYRAGRDYEDYAPAYCAGYVGFAQYGGNFEDAERSLVANWLRIRGGSRLDLEEAGLAMRAAWRRMEALGAAQQSWSAAWATLALDAAAPSTSHTDDEAELPLMQLAGTGASQRAVGALTAQP
jgi:hypothetical protein